jgi:hypothetical protein
MRFIINGEEGLAPLATALVILLIIILVIAFVPGIKESLIDLRKAWRGSP